MYVAETDALTSLDGQKSLTILLAEDDPLNRRFVVKFLTSRGHTVTAVDDGRQAVDALSQDRFDLVLMDVSMPEMDGLEATRAIRAGDGSRFDPAIPIIAVTAHAVTGDAESFLAAGMNAYISKPLDLDAFEHMIRLASQGYRRPASPAGAADSRPLPSSGLRVFDEALQAQRFAGMLDFLPELLALFQKNAPNTVAKAREALLQENYRELAQAGHTLKGMAAVVAAPTIAKTASDLETAANACDKSESQRLTAALDVQVRQAVEHMDTLLQSP